jgi:AcrR family transcriptional regulator
MARKQALRRQPVQQRGQRRIETILDAADCLFAEVGYDQATTNAIADRAQTSIGSLYQFFKNREAILQALAQRYHLRLRVIHESVMNAAETALLPLTVVYDRIIRALADFHRQNPGFRPLFFGSPTSAGLAEAASLLHEECISRVENMLSTRFPNLPAERRKLLATINVETLKALLPLSEQGSEEDRERVLREIKELLMGYMMHAVAPEVQTA